MVDKNEVIAVAMIETEDQDIYY